MRVYVTADLHLGHAKILTYEPARMVFSSIKEHDKAIEANWRALVRSQDVVYVLGDVAWNRDALERFRSFPGIKKLVMGNHDRMDMGAYLQCFKKVVSYGEIDGWLLAHMPVHPGSVLPRYKGQIHGHTHGHGSPQGSRYLSACLELHDFKPVVFEELVKPYSDPDMPPPFDASEGA